MVKKVWATEMGAMKTANGHHQIDCQIQHGQGTPLASARKTGVALANDVGSPLQNFHLTCSLDSSLNPPTCKTPRKHLLSLVPKKASCPF